MLPGAKRVYQEGFVVKEQIGAINNVIGCWVQCRIDLAKLCREATIIVLGIFPDTVADPVNLVSDLAYADTRRPVTIDICFYRHSCRMALLKRLRHWVTSPLMALPWVGAMTLTSRLEDAVKVCDHPVC